MILVTTAEGSDHACQQVMGKGARHLKVLEAHGDGVGLGNTDHDGQVALASSFLEDDDTMRGEQVLANAFHNHFDSHLAHPSQSPVTEYAFRPAPPHYPLTGMRFDLPHPVARSCAYASLSGQPGSIRQGGRRNTSWVRMVPAPSPVKCMRCRWPTQTTGLDALGAVPAVNIGLQNPQRNGHHCSIPHIRRTLR